MDDSQEGISVYHSMRQVARVPLNWSTSTLERWMRLAACFRWFTRGQVDGKVRLVGFPLRLGANPRLWPNDIADKRNPVEFPERSPRIAWRCEGILGSGFPFHCCQRVKIDSLASRIESVLFPIVCKGFLQ